MAVRKIDVSTSGVPTGYARGQAIESLDWSAISTQLTETMQAVDAEKQAKRDEIEKNSKEISTTLNNAPLGNHKGRNDALLEYAANAQQAMLMLDRELKTGNISLKDYTVAVQNLKDGTTQTFDIMEEWNKDYEEAMARMQNCGGDTGIDCSAAQEQFQMMQAEALGKLENHALFINPTNFRVTLGKREIDENGDYTGGISKNQNDFAEIQQLRNRTKQKINKFDLEGNLDQIENQLSTLWTEFEGQNPGVTITDARANPMFDDAITNWINSRLTNPVDVGSMLTDYLKFNPNTGNQYSFTMDPEEAAENEDMILLVNDPERPNSGHLVPDFSTENGQKQEKAAYDLLNTQIEGQLDRIEKPAGQEQKWKTESGETDTRAEDFITNVSKIWTGNNEDVQATLTSISGMNDDIVSSWVGANDTVYLKKAIRDQDGRITGTKIIEIPRGDDPTNFLEALIPHISGKGIDPQDLQKALSNSGITDDMEKGTGIGEFDTNYQEAVEAYDVVTGDGEDGSVYKPSDVEIVWKELDGWKGKNHAVAMETQADKILSLLPGPLTQGSYLQPNTSIITYKDADGQDVTINGDTGTYDKGASITIFYPELMTAPLTIPSYSNDSETGEKMVAVYNQIIKDIYRAGETGTKIRPIDYKQLIESYASDSGYTYDFDALNNAELYMHLGLIDDPAQWSGGDGVMQPESFRPSRNTQTETGGGDSMSDF